MAVDKLVDSTHLDSDLTSVANAIRAKSGGSSQLAFPSGFVSEIQAIPSGGGEDKLIKYATGEDTGNLYYPEVTGTLVQYAFYGCKAEVVFFPKATAGNAAFGNMPNLQTAVIKSLATFTQLGGCSNLKVFDGINITGNFNYTFNQCPKVDTLILRRTDAITPLPSLPTLNTTCFKNGGSGGTIYIPKVLYDHLGDGTALDYKSASNWATFDSYGTITWAKIEGSIYENAYADGTPIT